MKNEKGIKVGVFIAIVFLAVMAIGLAIPQISDIEMTDNGYFDFFTTGAVRRGSLFSYGAGDFYGQWLKVHIIGNSTGACATYYNTTINITLSYENVPTVLRTGARDLFPECLNTTMGTELDGALGGGHDYRPAPPSILASSPCSYNNLDTVVSA